MLPASQTQGQTEWSSEGGFTAPFCLGLSDSERTAEIKRQRKREMAKRRQQKRRSNPDNEAAVAAAKEADRLKKQEQRSNPANKEAVAAAKEADRVRHQQWRSDPANAEAVAAEAEADRRRKEEMRAQIREEKTDGSVERELLVKLHNASGSVIQANSMRLAPLKLQFEYRRRAAEIVDRRLEAQEKVFVELLTAAHVCDAESNGAWLDSAHCLHILSANYETLPEFVYCLFCQCEDYLKFIDRLDPGRPDDCFPRQYDIRLPRYDDEEWRVADIARLGWTREQLEHGGVLVLPDYENPTFTDGFRSRETRRFNPDGAWSLDPCNKRFPHSKTPQQTMIRTSRDVCKTDIHVSTLHCVPSQANAAKHRSADGLWEPRLYVIQREPTGDFPGLDYNVATNLWAACKKDQPGR